jgi:hypothetical protein
MMTNARDSTAMLSSQDAQTPYAGAQRVVLTYENIDFVDAPRAGCSRGRAGQTAALVVRKLLRGL